jgi:hypothetical protein
MEINGISNSHFFSIATEQFINRTPNYPTNDINAFFPILNPEDLPLIGKDNISEMALAEDSIDSFSKNDQMLLHGQKFNSFLEDKHLGVDLHSIHKVT